MKKSIGGSKTLKELSPCMETALEQVSFAELLDIAAASSSEEIGAVIEQLEKAKQRAEKREKEEFRRREMADILRQRQEERERREAHVREVTCMDLPLDWENAFDSDERTQGVHTDSIPDALVMSLNTLGRVDIEYIASVTGADYKTVINTLKGSIYQNPDTWGECFYKGWETAEEYLSGNLLRKLNTAKEAYKEYYGWFAENIKAIEKVLPPAVSAEDIYVTLGSPWVPASIIDDFILHLFGSPFRHNGRFFSAVDEDSLMDSWKTVHDEITGSWEIPGKSRYHHSVGVRKAYGTERMEALHILEKTLNMKSVTVTDEVSCPSKPSDKKRVINKAETVAALEKQQKLIKEFRKWVWQDDDRKKLLETIYENNFGCVRRRIFDGSFLEFPGMSDAVKLYPYQKNAAARIIFTRNVLLAHDVGAGKTYVMIAAGQELRRMGLSKKNLYVVPNNIVGQWKNIFLQMYPDAKLLCVEPKAFAPKKREAVLAQIRDEDFDGIIMAYSCLEQIPLSKDYYLEDLESKKAQVEDIVRQKNKATSRLRKKQEMIEKALADMAAAMDDIYDTVYFDELGITRLFVDEAHNFKNVPLDTKADNVLGISSSGSKKCRDMMDKVRMIQKQNGGGGVTLATGTPITNSVTDVYIMQQYLQSGELAMLDLQSFDSWMAEQVYDMLAASLKGNTSGASKQKGASASGTSKQGGGNCKCGQGAFDDHSRWDNESDDNTLRDAWTKHLMDACEAIEIRDPSNSRGLTPLCAKRILKELRRPQTDWRTVLNVFVQEEITDYSFTPPDRRFDDSPFFLPDFNEKEDKVEDILFMIDTSGSMSDDMITAAYSEVKGAIEQFGGRLKGWLGFFDAEVIEPKPFETEAEFRIIRPEGGGGTDFQIIFDYVLENMQDRLPASIIILTDGYAPFPDEAAAMGIPVLWLLNNEDVEPPWGKVARISVDRHLGEKLRRR